MDSDVHPMSLVDEAVLTALFCRAMRHAGDAMFEMTGRAVAISTPELRRCSPDEVMNLAGGPGALVVGIHLGINGAITGHALLVLPIHGALRLARRLLEGLVDPSGFKEPTGPVPEMDELERSALMELGNVTVSAVLNELGEHLGAAVHPTVPAAVTEFAGAVLDTVLLDLLMESDDILAARTVFMEGADTVDGTLLVLPAVASLRELVTAAGVH